MNNKQGYIEDEDLLYSGMSAGQDHPIYPEHNYDYLLECLENLKEKGNPMQKARNNLLEKEKV